MPFNWHVYLSETGAEISPLKLFSHVTKSLETLLKPGEILEVNLKYIKNLNDLNYVSDSWWPAEVVTISGHFVLFKWCIPINQTVATNSKPSEEKTVEMEQSTLNAFWFDFKGSPWDYLKPVGWCRTKNIVWSPPTSISKLLVDTTEYFDITAWAITLEKLSVSHIFFERRCLYAHEAIRIGGYFECEHEFDPSCVWPVKVIKNVGGRVLLSWFGIDSKCEDFETTGHHFTKFTLFYLHNRLHPLGYGKLYALKYCSPPGFSFDRAISNVDAFIRGACPATYNEQAKLSELESYKSLFSPYIRDPPLHEFKVGWKLEAVNPLKRFVVQPATVTKVFNTRYFLVELDDLTSVQTDAVQKNGLVSQGKIQFVGFAGMSEIMPANDSQLRGIYLSPPPGWPLSRPFTWTNYLTYLSTKTNQHLTKANSEKVIVSNDTSAGTIVNAISLKSSLSDSNLTNMSNSVANCSNVDNYAFHLNTNLESTTLGGNLFPFCPSESTFKGISIAPYLQKPEPVNSCTNIQSNDVSKSSCQLRDHDTSMRKSDFHTNTTTTTSASCRFLLGTKLEMIPPEHLAPAHYHNDIGPALCAATVTRVEYPNLLWLLPDLVSLSDATIGMDQCRPVMVDARSTNLYPVGWAQMMGYPFISPPGYDVVEVDVCNQTKSSNDKDAGHAKLKSIDECSLFQGLRYTHELQYYKINYSVEEKCPPIYISSKCYLGPFLCKTNLEAIPQRFGPGSVVRVMQNLLTRLVRASYKPVRVLRMLESDWISGLAATYENLNNAERYRCIQSASNDATGPGTKSLSNCKQAFELAEKEMIEQRRSEMRAVLINVRCPRRGIKIEVPVEVCCRTRAVEEFCRQISLIFEACPNLLTLVPPKPIGSKNTIQLTPLVNGCKSSSTNSFGEPRKDVVDPSQFPFDTSPSYDCPSFCTSRLRSRYLDRLPGWKRRMLASLRPFGNGDHHQGSGPEWPNSGTNHLLVNGHRTRSAAAAAASQRLTSTSSSDCGSYTDVGPPSTYSVDPAALALSKSKKKHMSSRSNNFRVPTKIELPLSSPTGRGRRKRSGVVRNFTNVDSNSSRKRSRVPNHDVFIQASVTNDGPVHQTTVTCAVDGHVNALQTSQSTLITTSSSCPTRLNLINDNDSSVAYLNRTRTEAIRHTLSQIPPCLLTQDYLNPLLSNIPRVILSSNPMFWTPIDLASYLGNTDCREMWPWLAAEAVDGQAFMLLTLPVLHRLVGLRWDDAVRLARHVISVKQAFVEQFGMNLLSIENTHSS